MSRAATLILLTLVLGSCRSATTPPSVEVVAQEFLGAYNSGSIDALTSFFLRHAPSSGGTAPSERALWVYAHVWQPIRTFHVFSATRGSAAEVTLLGQSAVTEEWYHFSFEIEPETGGVAFGFDNAEPPEMQQDEISLTAAVSEIAAYSARVCREDVFSGAILLALDAEPIYTHACGSSHPSGQPNSVRTAFNLGSATKMFTAVATLRLASDGKLDLGSVVGDVLPQFDHTEVRRTVTLEQLLTHSSGLGTFFTPEYRDRKRSIRTVEDLAPFITSQQLSFAPGTQYGYSNAGYALLGLVIATASGTDYYDFIGEAIYEPAGMIRSGWPIAGDTAPPRATGFTFMRESGAFSRSRGTNDFVLPLRGSPAGGSYATVEDLLAFDRALRSHRLLSEAATAELLRPHIETDRNTSYGYGFEITETRAGRIAGHNGHHFGISAQFDMYLDTGWTVVVLSDYDPPAAPVVARKIGRVIERVTAASIEATRRSSSTESFQRNSAPLDCGR